MFQLSKNFKKIGLGSATILLALFVFCFFSFGYLKSQANKPKDPNNKETIEFVVGKGDSVKKIAQNLEGQGIIKADFLFRFYVYFKGTAKNLKAGDYSLSPSMPISEIARMIASGETQKKKITILDGWNLTDIAGYFEGQGISKTENFYNSVAPTLAQSYREKFAFLSDMPEGAGLEGYIYPDTYDVTGADSAETLIIKALENFDVKLTQKMRDEIKAQGKNIFSIITMASLLEREANNLKDKKEISGILWKRLAIGMPLQVDASVAYVTKNKTIHITRDELATDSPYNTYKYKGLPIGPICNPGLDSITAAIYPAKNDYWYYLSTREGRMIFSRTFEDHLIAKATYLK